MSGTAEPLSRALVAALLVMIPPAGIAHTLDAPATVQAGLDGSFSYQWVFTVGPGSALLGGFGWIGLNNVLGGEFADCFCDPELCLMSEGETIEWTVSGRLTDAMQQGAVENWVSLCDKSEFRVTTVVIPLSPTPMRLTSGGGIKTLYR